MIADIRKYLSIILLTIVLILTTETKGQYSAEDHFYAGNEFLKDGQLDEAIEEYKQSILLDSSHYEVHWNLAIAYNRKYDYWNASNELDEVIKLNSGNDEVYRFKAEVLIAVGDTSNALRSYLKAFRFKPNDTQIIRRIAYIFNFRRQYAEANKYFKKLLEIDPNDPEAQLYLNENERILARATKPQTIPRSSNESQVVKRKPYTIQAQGIQTESSQRSQVFRVLVLILLAILILLAVARAGKIKNKVKRLKISKTYQRGNRLELDGHFSAALEKYLNVLDKHPDHLMAGVREGIVYYKLREYVKAIEVLKRKAKILPGHDQIKYFLGMSLIRNQQFREGRILLKELLQKHPDDTKLSNLIQQLDRKLLCILKRLSDQINDSIKKQQWSQAMTFILQAKHYDCDGILDLNHNIAYIRNAISFDLIEAGKRLDAIEIWKDALCEAPLNYVAMHNISLAYWFEMREWFSNDTKPAELTAIWQKAVIYYTLTFANPVFWHKMFEQKKWFYNYTNSQQVQLEFELDKSDAGEYLGENASGDENREENEISQKISVELSDSIVKKMTEEINYLINKNAHVNSDALLNVWKTCEQDWIIKRRALTYLLPLLYKTFSESNYTAEEAKKILSGVSLIIVDSSRISNYSLLEDPLWGPKIKPIANTILFDNYITQSVNALSKNDTANALKYLDSSLKIEIVEFPNYKSLSRDIILHIKRIYDSGNIPDAVKLADTFVKLGYDDEILHYCSSLNVDAGTALLDSDLRTATSYLEKAVLFDLSNDTARNNLASCFIQLGNQCMSRKEIVKAAKYFEESMLNSPFAPDIENGVELLAGLYNSLGVQSANAKNYDWAKYYFWKALIYKKEEVFFKNLIRVGGSISQQELTTSGVSLNPSLILGGHSFSSLVFKRWVHDVFRQSNWLSTYGKFQSVPLDDWDSNIDFSPDEMFIPHTESCRTMVRFIHSLYKIIKNKKLLKRPTTGQVGFNPQNIPRVETESHIMFCNEVLRIQDETNWDLFTKI